MSKTMSSSASPVYAFLGATGGCASHALALALQAGSDCRALARTPDKLHKLMIERGVSEDIIETHLTIVKGNAKSVADLKTLLSYKGKSESLGVDGVISGVGGTPKLRWAIYPVTLDDPQICQSATAALISALSELQSSRQSVKKPFVVTISTTGITSGPRDVPFLLAPLYHWALHVPHQDKKIAEQIIAIQGQQIADCVRIRPTLLVDGAARGVHSLRVGTEQSPAVGYTVSRGDVGNWIWETLMCDDAQREKWVGKAVTLTY